MQNQDGNFSEGAPFRCFRRLNCCLLFASLLLGSESVYFIGAPKHHNTDITSNKTHQSF